MAGDKEHKDDDHLPSTRTKRDITGRLPATRTHRDFSRVKAHYRKSKSKSYSIPKSKIRAEKELTGKQLLRKLIRYLNERIERRDRMERRKKN